MSLEENRTYRKDYQPPTFAVKKAYLDFKLDFDVTEVSARYECSRTEHGKSVDDTNFVLDGDSIELIEIALNGERLEKGKGYTVGHKNDREALVIPNIAADTFEITLKCKNFPARNSQLEGLYKTKEILCTHNEPKGFRRIVYAVDQPDVLTSFTVRLEGHKEKFPVMISNGNEIHREELKGGYHAITYEDPWLKAPHLFAIVAGHLEGPEKTITTGEGRKVKVRILSEKPYSKQLDWPLKCLEWAFKFDEEVFGRYYDLDVFTAAGVSDFNMGAMENKSLNIFNIADLACAEDTANDARFERVLDVVGHEYFHNWSGDRVTVRDWFQITLKEGFTSFREEVFEGWVYDPAVKRIQRVNFFKANQLPEDASDRSHPIRPESYVDVQNFYTRTIYSKGAEVIRMMRELVGDEGFRKGTDLYFATYDGQAISCDEFRESIARANGRDFSQFERWYFQRRTPLLEVTHREYDVENNKFILKIKQSLPDDANPNGGPPLPQHIPIRSGLVGQISKKDVVPERVLELTDWEQEFIFEGVNEDVVPSLLRGYSAPVILKPFLSSWEMAFLFSHDSDGYNQYSYGQVIYSEEIVKRTKEINAGSAVSPLSKILIQCVEEIFKNERKLSGSLISLLLILPDPKALCVTYPGLNPYTVNDARCSIMRDISTHFHSQLESMLHTLPPEQIGPLDTSAAGVANRALRVCLRNLLASVAKELHETVAPMVLEQYAMATNLTEKMGALQILCNLDTEEATDQALHDFYEYAKNKDDTVLDYWFAIQGKSTRSDGLKRVQKLVECHPDYANSKNPNRISSLMTAVLQNPAILHHPSGKGYKLVADVLIHVDKFNTATSARLAAELSNYNSYSEEVKETMRATCKRIYETEGISNRLKETVEGAAKVPL